MKILNIRTYALATLCLQGIIASAGASTITLTSPSTKPAPSVLQTSGIYNDNSDCLARLATIQEASTSSTLPACCTLSNSTFSLGTLCLEEMWAYRGLQYGLDLLDASHPSLWIEKLELTNPSPAIESADSPANHVVLIASPQASDCG